MERKRILFAVNNPPAVLELRKSLLTSGYEVKIVDNGSTALTLCREFRPHLLCADHDLAKIDGHHLFHEVKSQSATKHVAFVLMSKHRSVDERVHSIDLGLDDYISIPFDLEEILMRFEIILREIETVEAIPKNTSKGFSGKLSDLNLIELLQTLEVGQKSAIIKLQSHNAEGVIFLKKGEVLDASLKGLTSKDAIIRMFTWHDGTFRVDLRDVDQEKTFEESTSDLVNEGFAYVETWNQINKHIPSLQTTIRTAPEINGNLSPQEKSIMALIEDKRKLVDLIEQSDLDDLTALKIVTNLYKKNLIVEVPLEELKSNGKPKSVQKDVSANPISNLISNFLTPTSGREHQESVERRRKERRKAAERRVRPRRWCDLVGEENQVYLNKSELLMIRDKLTNGRENKDADFINTYN